MMVEFWVVRVLMHRGPKKGPMRLGDPERELPQAVLARIDSQELACLPPDWVIAEAAAGPFTTEAEALERKSACEQEDPEGDYRHILNADGV